MLPKIYRYEDPFFENTGEPRVQLLEPTRHKAGFYKHASQEVNDYLSTVSPEPGKRYVLVLAMSAGEYYGPNRNGDAFSEDPVKINGDWAVSPGETLRDHYETFETHACCYRHHINQDPNKKLGDVVKAFYNDKMHRVELLLEVDECDGSDIVTKLDAGKFPGVSMGCKIRYDVCSICGNKAPTRDQYCEHVNGKNPEFGMNQLMPDGRRCFVWNPSPTLFDISFVFKPADKIGYTMKKVAGADPYELKLSADLGKETERLTSKKAELQKLSDIDKIIYGDVVDPENSALGKNEIAAAKSMTKNILPNIVSGMEELPEDILSEMSSHSFPSVFSTMNACGMCPSTPEIYYMVCKKQGTQPKREIADRIVHLQGVLAEVLSNIPDILDIFRDQNLIKISGDLVDESLAEKLSPYREKRALWADHLARQHIPESIGAPLGEMTGAFDPDQAYYTPSWKRLDHRDSSTGKTYSTTLESARRADWDNTKKSLIEGAGLGALTGVAAKALGASKRWQWLSPVAVGGGYFGTKDILDGQQVPGVNTSGGVKAPANSEFVEKRSSLVRVIANSAPVKEIAAPLGGGALLTMLMAQDHMGTDKDPSRIGSYAQKNPEMTTLINTGILSGGRHGLRGLRSRFKRAMMEKTKTAGYDPNRLPNISFDELVSTVGKFILNE